MSQPQPYPGAEDPPQGAQAGGYPSVTNPNELVASIQATQPDTDTENQEPGPITHAQPSTITSSSSLTTAQLPFWQSHLTAVHPHSLSWPLTRLALPGTHDSATYGAGSFPTNLARFNWHCQSLTIYEQCRLGIRFFDLRLERENLHTADSAFWPFHGAAKRTGDRLTEAGTFQKGPGESIEAQLRRFVSENPGEVLVLHVTVKDASLWGRAGGRGSVWEVIMEKFGGGGAGGKCVPSPDGSAYGGRLPTIGEAREKGWNFVLLTDVKDHSKDGDEVDDDFDAEVSDPLDPTVATFVRDYVWRVPGNGALKGRYTPKMWKSNNPEKIRIAIEEWMVKHETTIAEFAHFWAAQCQLTPSMNNVFDLIQSTWNPMITTSPKKLAKIMNPYVRDMIMVEPLWRRRASIVQFDFPEVANILDVASTNFDEVRLA